VHLFAARGGAAEAVVTCADELRRAVRGETVTYVVNRNINYTNICTYSCSFCAFSKSSAKAGLRDAAYDLPLEEIAARVREAWAKGATEVCLQGGIHPRYTGDTYVAILRAAKAAQPDMHVHAFSPLEVSQGAATLGVPVADYLRRLKDEGLGSLPGTAAEILDDEVRAQICPDKLSTAGWLEVVGAAHQVGLPTTSTIMFGHLDRPEHWARHLLAIRRQQSATGGFTEFVPLPFVHMASPIYLRGQARRGPTWRESVLMHAVARIALHGAIGSIQASWVKLGLDGAAACLGAGVNDLGGVLMNESISRAAGAAHGQELTVADLERAAASAGRTLRQRTTLYGEPKRQPARVEAPVAAAS
jgi:FO synthase